MSKILSKRARPPPVTPSRPQKQQPYGIERIKINQDGSWSFPEAVGKRLEKDLKDLVDNFDAIIK